MCGQLSMGWGTYLLCANKLSRSDYDSSTLDGSGSLVRLCAQSLDSHPNYAREDVVVAPRSIPFQTHFFRVEFTQTTAAYLMHPSHSIHTPALINASPVVTCLDPTSDSFD